MHLPEDFDVELTEKEEFEVELTEKDWVILC